MNRIMSAARGFVYWLLTNGPIGFATGTIFQSCVFDRRGRIVLPRNAGRQAVAAIIYGVYEYPERVLVKRWLPSDLDCVELGCSVGVVSRIILRKLNASRKLVAVEASKALLELALTNVSAAGFSKRFIPIAGAIHYGGDFVGFLEQAGNHVQGKVTEDKCKGSIQTQAVKLAEAIKLLQMPYSLVMDIEGSEFQLLKEDVNSFDNCQVIIAELHGDQSAQGSFVQQIAQMGFILAETKHSVYAFVREAQLSKRGKG